MKYWVPEGNGLKLVVIHFWQHPKLWWQEFKGSNVVAVSTAKQKEIERKRFERKEKIK